MIPLRAAGSGPPADRQLSGMTGCIVPVRSTDDLTYQSLLNVLPSSCPQGTTKGYVLLEEDMQGTPGPK